MASVGRGSGCKPRINGCRNRDILLFQGGPILQSCVLNEHRSYSFCLEGGLDWSPTARVQRGSSETARCTSTGDHLACPLIFLPSLLVFPSREGGLLGLPLCSANEGLLRPRVARAQKIRGPPSRSLLCEQEEHLAPPLSFITSGAYPGMKGT